MNLDSEVDTGLQAVSEADLDTYAQALLHAEAGSEALVVNQVKADATLAADINAEVEFSWQSIKDNFNWGAEKTKEKAHNAKESIKAGVDKYTP